MRSSSLVMAAVLPLAGHGIGVSHILTTVSPSSGVGMTQTFRFDFSNTNGFTDTASTSILFNSTLDGRNACFLYYDRASNAIFLINDASTGSTRVDAGSSATAQNSQCAISGSGFSASFFGDTIELNLTLTFQPAFAGAKTVYLNLTDIRGFSMGLDPSGTWTIPAPGPQPSVSAMTPNSGSGPNQTFTFSFSDPNGFTDIASATVLFSSNASAPNGQNACFLYFDRASNAVFLINDASTGSTRVDLGVSIGTENSQCILSGSASSAGGAGNSFNLNLALTFRQGFVGNRSVWASVQDRSGFNTGLQPIGTWNVNMGSAEPAPVSVTPASGSGANQNFSFSFSNAANISAVGIIFNAGLDGRNACFIYATIAPGGNSFYLINDASTGSTQYQASPIQNSQCVAGNLGAGTGLGLLSIAASISFKAPFAGVKNVYLYVRDMGGAVSDAQALGTWTVP